MKTAIWQIIVLILGLSMIYVIRESWQDDLRIKASIGQANCAIEATKTGADVSNLCANIKTFKIKGFNQ